MQAAVKANSRLGPVRRSCSGWAKSRRSARTAGCCSATARSTGLAADDDAVRPTGPFDPELPVLGFRRRDGEFEAILFNHSTHTIGTHKPGVRSPSFYGLAAQAIEKERGGTVIFFEGASGSTHNLDVPATEATHRIEDAVARALTRPGRGRSIASIG